MMHGNVHSLALILNIPPRILGKYAFPLVTLYFCFARLSFLLKNASGLLF
jgi:hypothetical protein